MLEAHIAAGPCWPKKMTINRLYDEVKHETPGTTLDPTASAAELLRIKQEQVEAGAVAGAVAGAGSSHSQDPLSVKRERMEGAGGSAAFSFSQSVPPVPPAVSSQYPGLFLTPDTQVYGPPPVNSQSNPPFPSPGGSPWVDILNNVRQQPNTKRDPSYSNYAPAPASARGVKPEPGALQPSQPVPSPMFSPVRQRSLVNPPPPTRPLPSLGDLFAQTTERPHSPEVQQVFQPVKAPSTLNCSRQLCDWTDPHVENCKKVKIQARCESQACSPGDLHALGFKSASRAALPPCPKLQESCLGKFSGLTRMPPECFNSGHADIKCREESSISMRLLYRRKSQSLKDPRVLQQDYAMNSQHTAAKTLHSQDRGAKWDLKTVISTWSAVNMIRVVQGDNPNLQDSDHESDIECLD